MCRFFSWKEVTGKKDGKKYCLHLDDKSLFRADGSPQEKVQELIKDGSMDRDFMGHHAICAYYGIKDDEADQGEVRDIWNADKLPKELRLKFKDPETVIKNFGKMIETYAPKDDLVYIIEQAPKSWGKLRDWAKGLLDSYATRLMTQEVLSVKIRRQFSVSELVKLGKYNGYINPNITDKNFPESTGKEEKAEAILICFHANVTSDEAMKVMKDLGLRPGTAKELLSLGIDHPEKQKEFPIVALGSRSRLVGSWSFPYLTGYDARRCLGLSYWTSVWFGGFRFLAFRK